jgi:hypothetical protein
MNSLNAVRQIAKRVHAVRLAAYGALLPWLAPCALASPSGSRALWKAYDYDWYATGLFHLDEAAGMSASAGPSLTEGFPLGEAALAPPAAQKGTATSAKNEAPMGQPAVLRGRASFSPEGRFAGSLQFSGQDAGLVGDLAGGAFTIEGWFRLSVMPANRAIVIHTGAQKPLALCVGHDGRLQLDWDGATYTCSNVVLRKGEWEHLALSWGGPGNWRAGVSVGGERVLSIRTTAVPGGTRYVIGNGPYLKEGFEGWVDEVRCSSVVRDFFPMHADWVDAKGELRRPTGRPGFRSPDDLIFHLDFNNTLAPAKSAAGTTAPRLDIEAKGTVVGNLMDLSEQTPYFVAGVEREGFVAGGKDRRMEFSGVGNLLPDCGTLAFWMQPGDWDNSARRSVIGNKGPEDALVLSAYQDSNKPVLSFAVRKNPEENTLDILPFQPGVWTHMAVTWEGRRGQWFIDGRPPEHGLSVVWTRTTWDASKPVRLMLGGGDDLTVIDDLRIFRRALSASEAANLAALFDRRRELRPLPQMDMGLSFNGVIGRVGATLVPLVANAEECGRARVGVTREGNARPVGSGEGVFSNAFALSVNVETPPLDFARYNVRAEALTPSGAVLATATGSFVRVQPPWWTNTIGISTKVMPDWDPLTVSGRTVSVSLRRIRFGTSGLPEEIVAQDQRGAASPILAAPVEVAASFKGNRVPLTAPAEAPPPRLTGEVRADVAGRLVAPDWGMDVDGYIEFDGMMWFRFALKPSPGKAPSLDSLVVRVPYRADSAELMHWWSGNHWFRNPMVVHIGATATNQGVVFRSNDTRILSKLPSQKGSFIPYLALAGGPRGMAWFAENDKGWTQSDATPAVSVERAGHTVTLLLRIISTNVVLNAPREFAFGLHPIPVKRLQKGWRMTPGWGVSPDGFSGNHLKGGSSHMQMLDYPIDGDWDAVQRRINGEGATAAPLKAQYAQFLAAFPKRYGRPAHPWEERVPGLYMNLRSLNPYLPLTREWFPYWRGTAWGAYDTLRYTPDLVNYRVWTWDEWIRRGFVKGAYFDDCWSAEQRVLPGPCAWVREDGGVQSGFQWLGHREYFKRIRQACWDRGVWPHFCSHTTHTLFIPYHAFFDVILDGEDFYKRYPDRRDFMDSWPPPRLRFMNPEKWGLVTTWLGWTFPDAKGPGSWFFAENRAYAGALGVHDILWTMVDYELARYVDLDWLRQSGLQFDPDTEFIPYWDATPVAPTAPDGLLVSAWRRQGRCVIMMANASTNRIEASLKLNAEQMGLAGANPAKVSLQDVDKGLLAYFDKEESKADMPKLPPQTDLLGKDSAEAEQLAKMVVEPPPLSLDERKAKDPDGRFEWKDGVLSCPVRKHDYRLFEFTTAP